MPSGCDSELLHILWNIMSASLSLMTQAYPSSPALPKLSNITWALKLKGVFQIYVCCKWFLPPPRKRGWGLWICGLLFVRYSTQCLLSTYWVLWLGPGWDKEISFVLKISQSFLWPEMGKKYATWEKKKFSGHEKNKGYIQGIAIILIWLEYWLGNREYWERNLE